GRDGVARSGRCTHRDGSGRFEHRLRRRYPVAGRPAPAVGVRRRPRLDTRPSEMSPNEAARAGYGESAAWRPVRPKVGLGSFLLRCLLGAAALFVAAALVPQVSINGAWGALVVMVLITIFNALLAPLLAALRLPYTLLVGFVLVLLLDAFFLNLASDVVPSAITVDSY